MKRIAVALSLVALSAYGIGCEKPAAAPSVKVETTPEGGAKVESTDAAGHTTTTDVKPEEKPAEAAPAEAKPADAAPAEAAPAEAKPEEKPADAAAPAEEKPAEAKPE